MAIAALTKLTKSDGVGLGSSQKVGALYACETVRKSYVSRESGHLAAQCPKEMESDEEEKPAHFS